MTFKRKGTFHVYIVRCTNGAYYTGSTNNLEKRIKLHNSGRGAKYLRGKGPVTLVYAKAYRYFLLARRAELEIKKLGRKAKDALVRGYVAVNGGIVSVIPPEPPQTRRTATLRSRTLTVTIACAPEKVYAFVRNVTNMPQWATTFCRAVRRSNGRWMIDTPQGPVGIRIAQKNAFGTLDHYVTPENGPDIFVPMRVVPNGRGSEIIFTLFQQPGMSAGQFRKDATLVRQDLRSLKSVLEARPQENSDL